VHNNFEISSQRRFVIVVVSFALFGFIVYRASLGSGGGGDCDECQ
jgi:hypothetical protein